MTLHRKRGEHFDSSRTSDETLRRPYPVSYTHLDVYKRQVLYQPAGVAGGGGGVAAYHHHRARGHGGDGCQRGFVAAFARRVNDDDIGARALGGQLGRSGTGVLAAEVGLVGDKAQAGGGLFRAVYSLDVYKRQVHGLRLGRTSEFHALSL